MTKLTRPQNFNTLSKQQILDEYARVKDHLGHQPGQVEFVRHSRVTSYRIVKMFRRYSDLVTAAGDTPMSPIPAELPPAEDYYNAYGAYLRAHSELPSINDWVYSGLKPGYKSFLRKFKCKWSEIPYLFLSFAAGDPRWQDVISLIPERKPLISEDKQEALKLTRLDSRLYDALPPILHDVNHLAFAGGSPYEFERKCVLAFRMLGFEVQELGRGCGRNPDGIAKDVRGRFAVIYDAKSRKDYYTTGTDDRQFTEYIKDHKKALGSAGYELVFFLIISSRFGNMLPEPLKRVRLETGVSLSYITAENLLRILSFKTTKPLSLDSDNLKELFGIDGEITRNKIERILK